MCIYIYICSSNAPFRDDSRSISLTSPQRQLHTCNMQIRYLEINKKSTETIKGGVSVPGSPLR